MTLHADQVSAMTVALRGEIDRMTAEGIAGAASLAQDARCDLVLDLSAVTFMDSQGVNALIKANQSMAAAGSVLTVHDPSAAVRRVIEVTGLSEYLGVERSSRDR